MSNPKNSGRRVNPNAKEFRVIKIGVLMAGKRFRPGDIITRADFRGSDPQRQIDVLIRLGRLGHVQSITNAAPAEDATEEQVPAPATKPLPKAQPVVPKPKNSAAPQAAEEETLADLLPDSGITSPTQGVAAPVAAPTPAIVKK